MVLSKGIYCHREKRFLRRGDLLGAGKDAFVSQKAQARHGFLLAVHHSYRNPNDD